MFGAKVRSVMLGLFFVLFLAAISNVYIFKHAYGNLSVSFTLDNDKVLKNYSLFYTILPLVTVMLIAAVYVVIVRFKKTLFLKIALFSIVLAEAALGG